MARTDITLTVGVDERIQGIDAAGRRIHDEMAAAGGAAGRDAGDRFGSEFSRSIAAQDGKLARAYDKVVNSISKVNETTQQLDRQRRLSQSTLEDLTSAEENYNRIKEDGSATEEQLADALEQRRIAMLANNSAMDKQIRLQNQLTRSNKDHLSAINSVIRAQDAMASEGDAGQSLLSAGKFISALRSVAIPVIGTAVGAVGANILAVTAAAAQGLWMIPAAAGAAGAAIGTLSVATMGFSDTVKEMGDPEKFAEAIQNLSPNAQQAALAIQALMEPLTALKNNVQDALFADFGPMINGLANQYLPAIQAMMTGIAGGFNSAAKSVFDQLMTPETQQVITNTINSLVAAFQNLAPAAGPFIDAISRIIETGSSYLPQLADSAAKAAREFATFIASAQSSGDLSRWFREGLDTLGQLWEMVKTVGVAFMNLAPIGREHLPQINEILKNMAISIPPIIDGLAGLITPFAMIAEAANKMWDVAGWALERMGTSATQVKGAVDSITNAIKGLIDMIPGLGPGLRMLEMINRLIPGGASQSPSLGGTDPKNLDLANRYANADAAGGGGSFGPNGIPPGFYRTRDGKLRLTPQRSFPTAGLAPFPAGGYAVPAPPPEKGSGGSAAESEPYIDPSLYSVDAIPVAPSGLTAANSQVDALALIAGKFGLQNSSDVRNEPGSFHHTGQAGDFSNSSGPTAQMHAYAMFLAQNFGHMIEELIYSDPVRGDVLIGGGKDVRGTGYYDAQTLAQHRNHVHVAVTDAMAPYLNAALQQGGMPGAMQAGGYVVDPEAVMRAENAMLTAKNDVEQKRLRLAQLEAKGNASQLELLTARNNVTEAENKYREADLNLQQARQGKYKELDGKMKGAAQGLGEIGAALADDFGLSEGLPGMAKWLTTFLANLAFAPMMGQLSAISAANPIQGGHGMLGIMGAQNVAAGGSPLGLSAPGMPGMAGIGTAPMGVPGMGGIGAAPMAAVAPMAPMAPMGGPVGAGPLPGPAAIGPAPIGGGIGTGAGMPGLAGAPAAMTPQTSQAPQAASPGGGFQGLGGLPMEAAMTATAGLDLLAPGASQAAQMGIKLANRTIAYGGQLAAIGVGGLMETFLPNNSSLADPSKSWVGRIASGIAGARPALPNTAGGKEAPAQTPMPEQQQAQQGGPGVVIENMVNQTPDGGQSVANQIYRSYAAGGMR